MAESLCRSPETTTTLLIGYTPTQNKFFFKKRTLGESADFPVMIVNKAESVSCAF